MPEEFIIPHAILVYDENDPAQVEELNRLLEENRLVVLQNSDLVAYDRDRNKELLVIPQTYLTDSTGAVLYLVPEAGLGQYIGNLLAMGVDPKSLPIIALTDEQASSYRNTETDIVIPDVDSQGACGVTRTSIAHTEELPVLGEVAYLFTPEQTVEEFPEIGAEAQQQATAYMQNLMNQGIVPFMTDSIGSIASYQDLPLRPDALENVPLVSRECEGISPAPQRGGGSA
jgi:hypothetical protein